jgi:hypothetical protein
MGRPDWKVQVLLEGLQVAFHQHMDVHTLRVRHR